MPIISMVEKQKKRVRAIQYDGKNLSEVLSFIGEKEFTLKNKDPYCPDWIIGFSGGKAIDLDVGCYLVESRGTGKKFIYETHANLSELKCLYDIGIC